MEKFLQKHKADVTGILSGFDRLVFRGTLRSLAYADGMKGYLSKQGVLLKDFDQYVMGRTAQLKRASCAEARRLGRPVCYLTSSKTDKGKLAEELAKRDGILTGLICVVTCVEPCRSFEIARNRQERRLELVARPRKCLFLYHYWHDPVFGFMNARIQTWFPFSIQICLNGREWLARQMDGAKIRYEKWDNCFPWIEDVPAAQRLMDRQLQTPWAETLQAIARQLNPIHEELFAPVKINYYWSVFQDEWATDILFRSPAALAAIYPKLVRGSLTAFGTEDVMRFFGKKPRPNFQGQVITSCCKRTEGVRVKHQLKNNSQKLYDKFGRILRPENTMNDPGDFKVYRPKEGDPDGPLAWRPCRRGIADLHRRAEVQQAANERHVEALASLDTRRTVKEVIDPVTQPTRWKGWRVRALRPWSEPDQPLLQIIARGEFLIAGFRNRDLVAHLYPDGLPADQDRRQVGARVTRLLRILRAHRVIRKVPHTHRYLVTPKGREMITAILQTYTVPVDELMERAA